MENSVPSRGWPSSVPDATITSALAAATVVGEPMPMNIEPMTAIRANVLIDMLAVIFA